jgi:hypothetical protein
MRAKALGCGCDSAKTTDTVANQSETTMTLTDTPDDDERAVIMDGLRAYNRATQ